MAGPQRSEDDEELPVNDRERIEEAHGLWELAICRLAALVEGGAKRELIRRAVDGERRAFYHWREVSGLATITRTML